MQVTVNEKSKIVEMWLTKAERDDVAICGHQRPLVRWQTATVRCVSGQPELAFSRRFCGDERPVYGPAATGSK